VVSELSLDRFYKQLLELPDAINVAAHVREAMRLLLDVTCSMFASLDLESGDKSVALVVPQLSNQELSAIRYLAERVSCDGVSISLRTDTVWFYAEPLVEKEYPIGALSLGRQLTLGDFSDLERERIRLAARQIRAVADGVRGRCPRLDEQVTALRERAVRAALAHHDWNVSAVARQLGIGRSFVYSILQRRRKS